MARIRTIKPDAFKSDSLSRIHREIRWTFAGLWTYLDDEGRGRYDPRLIKAELYPLDDNVTAATLESEIDALEAIGSVCRYEVAGKRYIHAPNWLGHQKINRPTASKLPSCDADHAPVMLPPVAFTEDSVSTHGGLTIGKGTGNREGNRDTCASADAERVDPILFGFDAWYSLYPRKKAKGAAVKAYRAARKKASAAELVAGLRRALPEFQQRPVDKIPYPATWLNAESWNDEQPAPERPAVTYPDARTIEAPPDGLSDEEYRQWWLDRRSS